MCGITGIIGSSDTEVVKKMTDAISHRGPDDEGYYSDEEVSLGMRRLAIIDLERGKQPITSPDARFTIFFNGEIYNYKEIKKELGDYKFRTDSDTEVILAGFQKWGIEVLKHLRGMFVFCIYDRKAKKIFLARDFFGIKPLYYLKSGERITAFSSEIKSFLVLPDFKPVVNDEAVFNYLSYQYNPLEETFVKNVFKLPPAHYLTIDLKTSVIEKKRYWQFKFEQNEMLDEKKTAQKILEVMENSVSHHLIADVPVGSFLSGGIDSSIIATLMQKIRGSTSTSLSTSKKIKTFTVGFQSFSEGKEARETADFLGTDHSEITVSPEEYFRSLPEVVWHFDEPVADPSAVGLYFLSKAAAKHVKVVLSGEGSDELFGGYNIYLAPLARAKMVWLPRFILKLFLKLPFKFFGKNYLHRVNMNLKDWYIGNASIFKTEEIAQLWSIKSEKKFSLESIYKEINTASDSTQMQYIDIQTWLIGDILAKADKMTMAHSLELRVPFLDVEVAGLAATLPDRFKWHGGVTKYLLRQAFRKVLPESVRQRKKLGFPTPVKNWFTNDKTSLYKAILENSYIKSHMNTIYIQKLINDHLEKKADNSRKIYLLLMLAFWYNIFIER